MKALLTTGIATLAGTLLFASIPTTAYAQDAQTAPRMSSKEMEAAQRFVTLETVTGSKVKMVPGYEERKEAADQGEKADAPEGKVENFLFDPKTGRITKVLLGVGGFIGIGQKTVAIAFEQLHWNPADDCFELAMTKEQLEAAPDFDLSKEKDAAKKARATEASAGTAATRQAGDKLFAPYGAPFFVAGEVDELELFDNQGEEFGGVTKSIVDLQEGRVAYLIIHRGGVAGVGGDHYAIPFQSTMIADCREDAGDDDPSKTLYIDKGSEMLKLAPMYEEPEEGVLTDAQRQSIDAWYGKLKAEKVDAHSR